MYTAEKARGSLVHSIANPWEHRCLDPEESVTLRLMSYTPVLQDKVLLKSIFYTWTKANLNIALTLLGPLSTRIFSLVSPDISYESSLENSFKIKTFYLVRTYQMLVTVETSGLRSCYTEHCDVPWQLAGNKEHYTLLEKFVAALHNRC